tara:strand:- start:266 stop:907 length:642 start_codon:yes stop_codon:yes gene_type:complete
MEIFKDCDFDNRYKISNKGTIKKIKSNGEEVILKGSILNKNKSHKYKYIQIQRQGKRINYLIHRLVATAFLEKEQEDYNVVDHIDRDTYNNNLENLRWVTQKMNCNNTSANLNDCNLEGNERMTFIKTKSRQKILDSKKYYCSKCDVNCSSNNKYNKHLKTKKHNDIKGFRIKENKINQKEEINCECGSSYQRMNKSHHIKTKKHLSFINSKE